MEINVKVWDVLNVKSLHFHGEAEASFQKKSPHLKHCNSNVAVLMCFKFESVQRSCSARGPARESVCPSRAFSKAVLN